MKKLYKIFSFVFIYIFLSFSIIQALEKKKIINEDELVDKLETLNWYNITNGKDHNTDISEANARIQILATHSFLLKKSMQFI